MLAHYRGVSAKVMLLAAEAPDESALAHPERVGETADGEALKTDDGSELDGGIDICPISAERSLRRSAGMNCTGWASPAASPERDADASLTPSSRGA